MVKMLHTLISHFIVERMLAGARGQRSQLTYSLPFSNIHSPLHDPVIHLLLFLGLIPGSALLHTTLKPVIT